VNGAGTAPNGGRTDEGEPVGAAGAATSVNRRG